MKPVRAGAHLKTLLGLRGAARSWLPLLLAGLGGLAHWRAMRTFRALPSLGEQTLPARNPEANPLVSIIIPARNEAVNLPPLLADLRGLWYQPTEVIVVDDQSTDGTTTLAAAAGARVLATTPPPGWAGKPNACLVGARAAHGDWLLFVDADTRHRPISLAAALALAEQTDAAVVSVMPDQRCERVWEQLVIPFVFASYFAAVLPGRLNRAPADALLNGQYVLIRRAAYWSIGGHAAVARSLVEDVALGQALVRQGHRVVVGRAAGLVAVRMYRSWASLVAGFEKNTFAFLTLQPARGFGVAAATVAASLAGPALVRAQFGTGAQRLLGLLAFGLAAFGYGQWVRAAGGPGWLAVAQPVAATASLWIVLRSAVRVLFRQPVNWKGRTYPAP